MTKSGPSHAGINRWARGMAESATPTFLLDAKRRLLLFNPGCTTWTGWPADELLGLTCDYVTEADSSSREALLAACAPPAEVWHGSLAEVPVFLPHRTGETRSVRLRFRPLLDAALKVVMVLGEMLPVDEPVLSTAATPAQQLHAELAALRHQIRNRYSEETVIANSLPMRRVLTQLTVAVSSTGCVLFQGERGVGREHLARTVHARGRLAKQAFVPVDCRRTESTELKRILKHLRDDHHEHDSLRTGTLFLSEISAAPRDFQERLANWLATDSAPPAPRILAATDHCLQQLTDQEQFHRELFFLLTPLIIEVPALRHRAEDVLPLAQFFLEHGNRINDKQLTGFAPDAADLLLRYNWPGNVQELSNVVHAATRQSSGPLVTPENFPLAFRAGQDAQRLSPPPERNGLPLETVLEHVEREHIQTALAASRNNVSKAAEWLGLSRPKLYRRLEALGLLPEPATEE